MYIESHMGRFRLWRMAVFFAMGTEPILRARRHFLVARDRLNCGAFDNLSVFLCNIVIWRRTGQVCFSAAESCNPQGSDSPATSTVHTTLISCVCLLR